MAGSGSMGGTTVRRPLDEVVAELEAQQAAAEEAEKAARKRSANRRSRNTRKPINSAWTR
jgi:hypothetical protein